MSEGEGEVKYLHFSFDDSFGAQYTSMARHKAWWDCKPDKAILMLVEVCIGMTPDQARDIINGKAKLETGEDNVSMKMTSDDWKPPYDPEEVKKEIHQTIDPVLGASGVVGGLDWSWLDTIDEDDLARLKVEAQNIKSMMEENLVKARARNRQLGDWMFFMMEQNSEKYEEDLKDDYSYKNVQRAGKFKRGLMDGLRDEVFKRIATNSNMDEATKRRIMMVAKGQLDAIEDGVKIEQDKEMKADTGWLNPEGEYYWCGPGQHIPLAHDLVEHFYQIEPGQEYDLNDELYLEEHGWIKCTDCNWHTHVEQDHITMKQYKAIEKWVTNWGQPFHFNTTNMTIRELRELVR